MDNIDKQTIIANVSPRPWRVYQPEDEYNPGMFGTARILDANGNIVVSMQLGQDCYDLPVAALIVDAVNYYKPDLHCDWRKLTPEEAVAHCREVATRLGDTPCARDHLQLAEWIEERDRLRDIVRRIESELDRCHRRDGEISQELIDAVYEASAAIGEGE